MKLSTKTEYGLRTCFILALHAGQVVSVTELVRMVAVTQKYLEKILALLVASGHVATKRGANGGYALSRSAADITVGEIVRTLEDDLRFLDCVGGGCSDAYCPNRSIMQRLYDSMNAVLDNHTLEDLVKDNTCKKPFAESEANE